MAVGVAQESGGHLRMHHGWVLIRWVARLMPVEVQTSKLEYL